VVWSVKIRSKTKSLKGETKIYKTRKEKNDKRRRRATNRQYITARGLMLPSVDFNNDENSSTFVRSTNQARLRWRLKLFQPNE
jgi:hypothetical protein